MPSFPRPQHLPLPRLPQFRRPRATLARGAVLLAIAAVSAAASDDAGKTAPTAKNAQVRSVPRPPAETPLARADRALDAGDPARADSLLTVASRNPSEPATRHRREILNARLAASRGDWKTADATLRAWLKNPERREGSGETLFWMGWAAMHQARANAADSLLVLASAYGEEPRSQDALEYRFAGMLENGPGLQDYLRGLPESPLPHSLRVASLFRVNAGSRLHPHARWHLALLHEARGDTAVSRALLDTLARDARSMPGRRAAAYRALLAERNAPDTALAAYETLLVGHQQGVTAEFARKRARELRGKLRATP